MLATLVVLGLLIAMTLITRHEPRAPDCATRIVMLRGPHGEPLECVCVDGALSTCFNPGP